jgi:hypothetical protein
MHRARASDRRLGLFHHQILLATPQAAATSREQRGGAFVFGGAIVAIAIAERPLILG